MPAFETLPRFERDWKNPTRQQQATFRKVITEYFVPDLAAPDRPFRPGLPRQGRDRPSGRIRDDMGQRRTRDLQLWPGASRWASPCHLATHREPRDLHPAARPVAAPRNPRNSYRDVPEPPIGAVARTWEPGGWGGQICLPGAREALPGGWDGGYRAMKQLWCVTS
jgi:hypothetical protein